MAPGLESVRIAGTGAGSGRRRGSCAKDSTHNDTRGTGGRRRVGLASTVEHRARLLFDDVENSVMSDAKSAGVAAGTIVVGLIEVSDSGTVSQEDVADVARVNIPTARRYRGRIVFKRAENR